MIPALRHSVRKQPTVEIKCSLFPLEHWLQQRRNFVICGTSIITDHLCHIAYKLLADFRSRAYYVAFIT
jgi:hypothetical protein